MLPNLAVLVAIGAVSQVQAQSLYACDTLSQPDWESCRCALAKVRPESRSLTKTQVVGSMQR